MQHVLVLGAGMVSSPLVKYLLSHEIKVTLADMEIGKAKKVLKDHPNGTAIQFNASEPEMFDKYVPEVDLVVSLLPYSFHAKVLDYCIKYGKNMVTTSYLKPYMLELEPQIKEAGIIMLNEVGVDPGIDHMSAMRIINKIHKNGGSIKDFYSFCGALPAPEAANNPFKYRFSWSPWGVLMAVNNPATYLQNNKQINISAADLFKDSRLVEFNGLGEMEVYPNRNSLEYIDIYNIPEAETVLRGTIRYQGWSEIIDGMKSLKLFDEVEVNMKGKTFADFSAYLIGEQNSENIKARLAAYLNLDTDSKLLSALEYIGLFSDELITKGKSTHFDLVADLMIDKLILYRSERDMVVMQHVFSYVDKDNQAHILKSKMKEFGDTQATAVARTVALPAAIACRMILEGKINLSGVFIPTIPEIYEPILNELELMGIRLDEEIDPRFLGISS
ncbi:saccharopine dehydrogenase C-terminal domain-containing protein [Bacteroidota bacterium]